MKIKMIIAFAMVALISFAGCGNGETSDNNGITIFTDNGPQGTYKKFMQHVIKEDYIKAIDMVYEADKASDEEKTQFAALLQTALSIQGGIKDFEILNEEITEDGTKATLKVKYTYGNGSTKESTERLVKTDNGWAVKL